MCQGTYRAMNGSGGLPSVGLAKSLVGAVAFFALSSHADAERALTYPGVIMSNRSTPLRQASVEAAASSVRFVGLATETLAAGTVHVKETKLPNGENGAIAARRDLCRTARVRRIMHLANGHITCARNYEVTVSKVPNDPAYDLSQWGPKMMAAGAAWDITTGTNDAVVAVVDTGIFFGHPDLRGNLWVNPKEIPNNGLDDDYNGFIDDVHGANAITRIGSGSDDNRHGSHVAGIIGASGDNAQGIVGLNWRVRLMAVKFLSFSGSGSTADAIKAIQYVVTAKKKGHSVVAINASWGGPSFSKPLLDVIRSAGAEGILFVAAAGNSARNNDTNPSYPASFAADNVISVASIDSAGTLSSFSNYGKTSVHIAAPGESIYSTLLNGAYGSLSGTSMAAPHVAGLAALAYSACPRLTIAQLKEVILANGVKTTPLAAKLSTGSIANAAGAVLGASSLCAPTTPSPTATPDPNAPPTRLPTSTPTATPTPTITPTPTATPLPTGAYLIADPSTITAGSPLTLKISTGNVSPSTASLRYTFIDDNSETYTCVGSTVVPLPLGSRTVQIPLSADAKHFRSIHVSFATLKGKYSTQLSQTGTVATLVPNSKAARLCEWLTSRRIQ
jgi:subtilisin family serine protease